MPTPSQRSSKSRASKIEKGYRRIPDLISPEVAKAMTELIQSGWASTQTEVIEKAILTARTNNPA